MQQAQERTLSSKAEVTTTVDVDGDGTVRGTVRIAPAVLIQLIEMTVQDIRGVEAITAHRRKKDDIEETHGKAFDDGKVRVVVDGDQIDADVAVIIQTGANVSRLSNKIREKVGLAAGRMLGMRVRNVNIYVDNIVAPGSTGQS